MELAFCYPQPEAYRFARQLGGRLGYIDFCWPTIQPEPGVFDFSAYDPIIDECAATGLELIGAVSSVRVICPDGRWVFANSRGMMPDPAAWTRYLTALVERYKATVRYWEVWSEPNCTACNPMSYYDPRLYREVLKLGGTAIRAADPTAKIVLGGLWFNNYTLSYTKTLLAGGQADDLFDIFSFHFFLMTPIRAAAPFSVWQEPLSRWVDFFRRQLARDCPIWITEFGLPTSKPGHDLVYSVTMGDIIGLSEAEQADWFSAFVEAAETQWDIGAVTWICLRDKENQYGSNSFNDNLGLLRVDGSAKAVKERVVEFMTQKTRLQLR